MRNLKRIFSTILAIALCLTTNIYAFATETGNDANCISATSDNVTAEAPLKLIGESTYLVSDSGIMPLSSVNGFNQKTITTSYDTLTVKCNGSGTGGMGITIAATSSYGDYVVKFSGRPTKGSAASFEDNYLCTNNPLEYHNLWQSDLSEYVLTFQTESTIPPYLVKVWIYG